LGNFFQPKERRKGAEYFLGADSTTVLKCLSRMIIKIQWRGCNIETKVVY